METDSRYDDLTADQIATLFEEGASPEFVQLAQYDDGRRNSVRENARAALEHGRTEFGSFGTYMWEGDMYNAMKHADGSNTELLLEVFGLAYINGKAKADGKRGYKKNEDGRVVYE